MQSMKRFVFLAGFAIALLALGDRPQMTSAVAPPQNLPSPWLKPDAGMVLAWVSAVDPKGNAVPGLKRNNFRIWENDVEQSIEYFAQNSDPITVGFIPCGSIECAEVPMTFLKTTTWDEEYFVVVENRSAQRGGTVLQNFTTDIGMIPRITPSTH